MLLIKTSRQQLIALSLVFVFSLLNSPNTLADHNADHEPQAIFPIPDTIVVNESKAKLGEKLFFDKRLSKNASISCASCHQLDAGGDDNVARGISLSAEQNTINTPSIFNAVYNFRQNWNGSAESLHQQIDLLMTNQHAFNNTWDVAITRLASDANLSSEFALNYQDGINKHNIIDALVEFEKTLVTPNARFDRFLRNQENNLSKEELNGYKLFNELGCISCHQGINLGGNLYQKFGVFYNYMAERGNIEEADHGRFNITRRPADDYVFKVPSLRNVAVTAPYFHDGSVKTIEEAIEIMGRTQLGRVLIMDEILLIKAFLNSLTGEYKNKPLDANQ